LSRFLSVKAPTRIDLGGGWTDVPPYCDREMGFVCNVAIDRFATATVSDEAPRSAESSPDKALIDAAVRRSGLRDVHISVNSDYPVGAGLGGSSAASAAVLGALRSWRDIEWDLCEIAEEGRAIEVEDMKIAGGRQDHYAATHGGALGLRFTDVVEVNRIVLQDATKRAIERRALIVYTGESRISGSTITAVTDAYLARDRRVLVSLRRMRELAEQMAAELADGDVDDLAAMVDEHWEFQRNLHPAIPTALIDEIVATARKAGAIGAKALGASGGGCVLLIARDDNSANIRQKVEPLGTPVPFQIALDGLSLA
jgi:D-glycero-alpha-D-manno-heptose-7-phosphate kinase